MSGQSTLVDHQLVMVCKMITLLTEKVFTLSDRVDSIAKQNTTLEANNEAIKCELKDLINSQSGRNQEFNKDINHILHNPSNGIISERATQHVPGKAKEVLKPVQIIDEVPEQQLKRKRSLLDTNDHKKTKRRENTSKEEKLKIIMKTNPKWEGDVMIIPSHVINGIFKSKGKPLYHFKRTMTANGFITEKVNGLFKCRHQSYGRDMIELMTGVKTVETLRSDDNPYDIPGPIPSDIPMMSTVSLTNLLKEKEEEEEEEED